MFPAIRMDPAPSERSIEYYSEFLNHVSKIFEKYTDNLDIWILIIRYIFALSGFPNFLTRDLVTMNNTQSISHSPRSLGAGPIRNTETMRSLLNKQY